MGAVKHSLNTSELRSFGILYAMLFMAGQFRMLAAQASSDSKTLLLVGFYSGLAETAEKNFADAIKSTAPIVREALEVVSDFEE